MLTGWGTENPHMWLDHLSPWGHYDHPTFLHQAPSVLKMFAIWAFKTYWSWKYS